jgi:diaminopimelate decarboxylase
MSLVRQGVGHTDSETASNVLAGPSSKFGVPRSQIVDAYRQAAAHGATRFGIHMMMGSCVLDDDVRAVPVSDVEA